MPQTYMNRSGQAVREILSAKKLSADRLLVVTDDFDLPLGGLRIRKEGSPGTHKGMQSISQEIQTRRFPRIRIGIGGCGSGEDSVSYVLSPFEERERPLLRQALSFAQQALDLILQGKIDAAMNRYNRKNPAL
jgi:PTH1 family peptidyl-tRNA hydrolase